MRNRKGFTLLEMMIVVAIIILLIGIALGAYTKLVNASAAKATTASLSTATSLLSEYEQASTLKNLGAAPGQPGRFDVKSPYWAGEHVNVYTGSLATLLEKGTPIGPGTSVQTGDVTVAATATRTPNSLDPTDSAGFLYVDQVDVDGKRTNSVYNTAAVMMFLVRVPQVRQMVGALPGKSILSYNGKPIYFKGTTGIGGIQDKMDAPVLADGWGNPIIYVPASGLVVHFKQGTDSSTGTTYTRFIVRTSGVIPIATPYIVPPSGLPPVPPAVGAVALKTTDRPFWASAGPDGNFNSGEDNIYSFQQ